MVKCLVTKTWGLIQKVLEINKGKTSFLLEKKGLWIHVNEIAQAVVAVEFWEETRNVSSQLTNNSATIKFFPCSAATKSVCISQFPAISNWIILLLFKNSWWCH